MKSNKLITILTGAGISAESGIQTFRDNNGMWHNHRIEDVATPEAFERNPKLVQDFYNQRRAQLLDSSVAPNAAHVALAKLQREFKGRVVLVTQNVDNLHERAGSTDVIHMHGELLKVRCTVTEDIFDWRGPILTGETQCPSCGAVDTLRPHIVWFGEMPLDMDAISAALTVTDVFVSIGTSGNVYPAAGFAEQAGDADAYTLELNKEGGSNGNAFDESRYGPATTVVSQWVEDVLSGAFFEHAAQVKASRPTKRWFGSPFSDAR